MVIAASLKASRLIEPVYYIEARYKRARYALMEYFPAQQLSQEPATRLRLPSRPQLTYQAGLRNPRRKCM